jgi:acetolactate synthase-1/2/3 large subunit
VKASDYIIEYLIRSNITRVYGYIGGMITHLVNSIYLKKDIEMISTITEQGAAFAAEGEARITGNTGVVMVTSGPGATNLVTGIASCFFDSTPVIFITGQVNTYEYKGNIPIRQNGFQETEIVSIVRPITKYSVLVDNVENLRYELEKAIFLTQDKRKGPVLLDIPMNIQQTSLNFQGARSFFDSVEYKDLSKNCSYKTEYSMLIDLLKKAKRPLILAGSGVRSANAVAEFRDFLVKTQVPVVESLLGIDSVSKDYKYNMGLIGSYGNRFGNYALANSDFLLVLGSRLDTRQTGTEVNKFLRETKIVRVDIDPSELKFSKVKSEIAYCCDLKTFLLGLLKCNVCIEINEWYAKILEYKNTYPSYKTDKGKIKNPNYFIYVLSQKLKENDVIIADVGQNQMWTAQSLNVKYKQRMVFSGGMGAMGFALPTSIGAALSFNHRIIVIVGDGGMQMNIQELEILKRRNLKIKIIVMNNFCLGMVRQFQEKYFNKCYACTVEDYSAPNFTEIAWAYGLKASNVSLDDEDWEYKLDNFLKTDSPEIFNFLLDINAEVEPKLLTGKSFEDLYKEY